MHKIGKRSHFIRASMIIIYRFLRIFWKFLPFNTRTPIRILIITVAQEQWSAIRYENMWPESNKAENWTNLSPKYFIVQNNRSLFSFFAQVRQRESSASPTFVPNARIYPCIPHENKCVRRVLCVCSRRVFIVCCVHTNRNYESSIYWNSDSKIAPSNS